MRVAFPANCSSDGQSCEGRAGRGGTKCEIDELERCWRSEGELDWTKGSAMDL